MFTDRQAVHGGVVTKRRDAFSLKSNGWPDNSGARNGERGFGLPSPSKYRSGHMTSGASHVSRVIPASEKCDGSGSDVHTSSDSEDEVYGGKYSLDSSPQDYRIPNGVTRRCTAPMQGKVKDDLHKAHSNLSSLREPIQQKQANNVERFQSGFADELSDSVPSIDASSMHCRSSNDTGHAPQLGAYASDCCSSSVTSQAKDFHRQLLDKKLVHKDMPSAPPTSSGTEIGKRVAEMSPPGDNNGPFSGKFKSSAPTDQPKTSKRSHFGNTSQDTIGCAVPDPFERIAGGKEINVPKTAPARLPTFHASGQGQWCAVISYDACVRLCLHSWARGCTEEAPYFLNNECSLLRNAFGLQQVLLQAEEELLTKRTPYFVSERVASKPRQSSGKIKVQVRRVQMGVDPPPGCSFSPLDSAIIKLAPVRQNFSNLSSALYSGWEAARKVRVTPRIPPDGSFPQQGLAYMRATTQYVKQFSKLFRHGVTARNTSSSYEVVQETHTCLLRLKSSPEEDSFRMQPGSGENHVFFPDNHGDDLIIEVHDSKGQHCGRALAQMAAIADDPNDKIRWWPLYREPDHESVGRIQLYITYSTTVDESNQPKCGCVAETVAYDFVLEVAMKVQHFQQRNLLLHGTWKWLVTEFASYYGLSDAYTKLRYLSYVMDVATPTKDCLDLVYDLLHPVVMKGNRKTVLSHQENRILREVEDQIQQILALTFENYKSLDELSPSGVVDVFGPATGLAAPVLASAVKLYSLLHDILSPESQLKFSRYFQVAAKKRSRRYLAEMDEFTGSNEGTLMDHVAVKDLYQKMKCLVLNIRNEICADIQIHNQHLLPSFMDLPNMCAAIYNVDLSIRLCAFLVAYPPAGPSPPIAELVIATADFQRDLASWNINTVKGGIDAKEVFNPYIIRWICDKRHTLFELCKAEKVKWSGVRAHDSTTPFIHEMYEQLSEILKEYEIIISRWPEYAVVLENAIADVEKAIIESLEKQYADVLYPLKDNLTPKIFGYVQKIAGRTGEIYFVPDQLGILLNSMKRLLDVLRPKIGIQIKSWTSCMPNGVNAASGESLSDITVMLRSKFRNCIQAVVEKLVENTWMQSGTKLKRIIQDSKETVVESDVQSRMQLLKDLLIKTMDHLHSVVEPLVFIAICRGFWDRMGQEVLQFLQNRRENRCWYKCSRIAITIVDDVFASQMQQLLGNALKEEDLEPPRSILEVRSILCN